jgi:hypothetical protein
MDGVGGVHATPQPEKNTSLTCAVVERNQTNNYTSSITVPLSVTLSLLVYHSQATCTNTTCVCVCVCVCVCMGLCETGVVFSNSIVVMRSHSAPTCGAVIVARDDFLRLRRTPLLVSFLVGWLSLTKAVYAKLKAISKVVAIGYSSKGGGCKSWNWDGHRPSAGVISSRYLRPRGNRKSRFLRLEVGKFACVTFHVFALCVDRTLSGSVNNPPHIQLGNKFCRYVT